MIRQLITAGILAVSLATAAQARPDADLGRDVAAYRMAAYSRSGTPVVVEASITDRQWLVADIEVYKGASNSFREPTRIRSRRWRIADALYDDLLDDVRILRGAALTETEPAEFACMGIDAHLAASGDLMVSRPVFPSQPVVILDPGLGIDVDEELELVLEAPRCWRFTRVVPASPHAEGRAADLRAKLKALAAQRVGRYLDELRD